ncbi:MAG: hypothetical protein ACP5HM_12135 [Anaerolineae bacterium]
METLTLTRRQACRFILASQALYPPHQSRGREAILAFVRCVGWIQFDPLDVVGRNFSPSPWHGLSFLSVRNREQNRAALR